MIGSQIGAVMIRKTSAASSTMKALSSRLFSEQINGEVSEKVSACALRLKYLMPRFKVIRLRS